MRLPSTRSRVLIVAALATVVLPVTVAAAVMIGKDVKSDHWGVIYRNTVGSPVAQLRDGPFGAFEAYGTPQAQPPYGKGSLGIEVADGTEKIDFGNEVDFVGEPVLALSAVGFQIFQTGENGTNMPNIRFEIDANLNALPADNYTTMVWVPNPTTAVNRWSAYIDATSASTGYWYFTGAEGGATGCTQATMCSFTAAKTALNDGGTTPIFWSVLVGKGSDNRWAGAIDGLRVNDKIYDFEANGVNRKDAK